MKKKSLATPKAVSTKSTSLAQPWPLFFKVPPKFLLGLIITWLLLAWILFLGHDIYYWFDLGVNRPVWTLLFNDKPVEWTQWFLLAFATAMSGYLAARLDAEGRRYAARFFFIFAIALGLMLIEEAGDIRHVISGEVHRLIDGDTILGLPYRSMTDLPYFAALAAVPLYAFARYGRYVWQAASTRPYFITGTILYAIAAISSGARYIGDLYVRMGMWINDHIFLGRFPSAHDHDQETTYLMIIDSPIEETIETLAITMFVLAILIYARSLRQNKLPPEKK